MTTEIYYFSGTGNSFTVARDVAEKLNAKLIAIISLEANKDIKSDADTVGIVFPAYYMRMPRIVKRFIEKLSVDKSTYIFAIVTVGGIAGPIFDRLSEVIKKQGRSLSAGFVVRMPANYIHSGNALPIFLQKRMFKKCEKKIEKITNYIQSRDKGYFEKFNPIATFLFSGIIEKNYLSGELSPDVDKNFWTDDKCNGCKICQKICPVGNIKMVNDKPKWQNNCEKCLACIQWCPQQSIQFKDVTIKRKRYHHPRVKVTDIIVHDKK